MALSLRRPSDWSIVLRTDAGQQISFDRENRRISASYLPRRSSGASSELNCPLCNQTLPRGFTTGAQAQHGDAAEVRSSPSFVHPEYFGLLAACLEEETAIDGDEEFAEDHLRSESFNQGYCDRFFVEEGLLGRGGRGEVVKVRHILEGVSLGVFALKRVSVGNSQAWLIKMLREVQSLRFKHPNLVSYNHVWLEHCQRSFGPRVPVLHILQEYCDGGDLENYVLNICGKVEPTIEELKDRRRRKSRGQAARPDLPSGLGVDAIYSFFRDIVAGLAYLHEQGMIHRDMKSSNCLLDTKALTESGFPRILVSDFGEAQFGQVNERRSGGTGTLSYTAPEIVRGEDWSSAADMYSLGMILYFLTHEGTLPFHSADNDFEGLRQEILNFDALSFLAGQEQLHHEDKRELGTVLSGLLSPEASIRPTCADLLLLMQLHDRPAPERPQPKYAHDEDTRGENLHKWPPALRITDGSSLISIGKTSKGKAEGELNKRPRIDTISRINWTQYSLDGKDECLTLVLFLLRLIVMWSILEVQKVQLTLSLILLPVGLQLVERAFDLPLNVRMTSTVAFVVVLWLLINIYYSPMQQ